MLLKVVVVIFGECMTEIKLKPYWKGERCYKHLSEVKQGKVQGREGVGRRTFWKKTDVPTQGGGGGRTKLSGDLHKKIVKYLEDLENI